VVWTNRKFHNFFYFLGVLIILDKCQSVLLWSPDNEARSSLHSNIKIKNYNFEGIKAMNEYSCTSVYYKNYTSTRIHKTPLCMLHSFTAIYELVVWKMWEPQCLTTLWASLACYRDSISFYLTIHRSHLIRQFNCNLIICSQVLR
jgi:hypothetical protein